MLTDFPFAIEHIPTLSVAQMREVDRIMVEELGIPLIQMMEHAGRALADVARRRTGGTVQGKHIIVLAGAGHNGGGGLVAARHLHNWGADIHVLLATPFTRLKAEVQRQYRILQALGIPLWHFDSTPPTPDQKTPQWGRAALILDALLGYNLHGNPRGFYADLIRLANASRTPILSLDLPSGLDADDGTIYSPCIEADATLTLALPKRGLRESHFIVGDLYLADIGIAPEVYARMGLDVPPVFQHQSIVRLRYQA
nr:NAD(P)H-hydrate epimerase [Ardenticatena sp.]